jgi:hypothetical protein
MNDQGEIDINNLDNLLNYILEVRTTKNYKIYDIIPEELNLNNIKTDKYNLDIIFSNNKISFIREKHIGVDKISCYSFKRENNINSTINIVPYLSPDDQTDMTHPINVNLLCKTFLNEIILKYQMKHMMVSILNIDCKGSELKKYDIIKKNIPEKLLEKHNFSIQIMERNHATTSLKNYLDKYIFNNDNINQFKIVKEIIFQLIEILFIINSRYPKLRFNNLDTNYISTNLYQKNGETKP